MLCLMRVEFNEKAVTSSFGHDKERQLRRENKRKFHNRTYDVGLYPRSLGGVITLRPKAKASKGMQPMLRRLLLSNTKPLLPV